MKAEHYFVALEAVHGLWEAMDRNAYDTIIDRLTPDCRWLREGWLVGRDAIRASLGQRPRKVTRHLVTNLRVEESAGLLKCRHMLLFFGFAPVGPQVAPFPSRGPRAADYWVTLSPSAGIWLFSELRGELIFDHADPPGAGTRHPDVTGPGGALDAKP